MKHILTALFIGLYMVLTAAFIAVTDIEIDRLQDTVAELRQQADKLQSRINFLEVENGVLWRKHMEAKIEKEGGGV